MKLFNWLNSKWKCFVDFINPFYSDTPHLDKFIASMQEIHEDVKSVQRDLQYEKQMVEKELQNKETLLNAIIECIPDMVWCKDINGRYLLANKAIREGLLFDDNPIGKTDVQMSKAEKKRVGSKNHTFGEVCGNSDLVVLKTLKPERFLENGNVKGKNLELEVHKNVIRNKDGLVIGTVGTGRDITDYVEALRKTHECGGCEIRSVFDLHRYEGKIDG